MNRVCVERVAGGQWLISLYNNTGHRLKQMVYKVSAYALAVIEFYLRRGSKVDKNCSRRYLSLLLDVN